MPKEGSVKFDTLALHAGQHPDPEFGARAVPIYQTTSYVFPDSDHAAALFNLERAGHIYSRISNPTVSVLEERLAALEGGVGAVCTSSGQAALHLAIATLMDKGSHIVASKNIYIPGILARGFNPERKTIIKAILENSNIVGQSIAKTLIRI